MLDQLLSTLQGQLAPELMNKIGLDQKQASGSINAAAASVKQVLGSGDGFGMDDVLNLFSSAKNTSAADGILGNIGKVFEQKLTGEVGLNGQQAGGVAALVLPALTQLLSDKVGGNAANLQGLLGGLAGGNDLAGMAKGLLGGLFK
ncbi:MAG: hypothetical protein JNL05_15510 [Flavobacteriales bacterium]|nr:hypothetical protein [Flavobacteriales bacterium]